MEKDYRISKPVLTSSIAAEKEAQNWTREQNIKTIKDADGDVWQVELVIEEGFESPLNDKFLFTVSIVLHKEVTAGDLVSSGVLLEKEDHRLLALIGGSKVHMQMKPIQFKDRVEAKAKHAARDYLSTFRNKLEKQSIIEVKRRLVQSWVDKSGRFGRFSRSPDKRLVATFQNIS